MNQEKAKILIQKYNQGKLSAEEEGACWNNSIEAGLIELEALDDIQQISSQLDEVLVRPIHESIRSDFYHMLETEKTRKKTSPFHQVRIFLDNLFFSMPGMKQNSLAYSLGLLIIGLGAIV